MGLSFTPAYHLLGPSPQEDARTVVLLHGILGSAQNWRSFARKLLRQLPGWRAVLIDHRGHGGSHGATAPHDIEACAGDVLALMHTLGLRAEAVLGHSFGGKVAIALAAARPPGLEQVWALDSPPGRTSEASAAREVLAVMDTVARVPLPIPSRNGLVVTLTGMGLSLSLARWMTTNLETGSDGFTWRFDLDLARELLATYFRYDGFAPLEATDPRAPRLHLVRAARSDRWSAATLSRLNALSEPAAGRLHVLADAGHWLHVDNGPGLLALMRSQWDR